MAARTRAPTSSPPRFSARSIVKRPAAYRSKIPGPKIAAKRILARRAEPAEQPVEGRQNARSQCDAAAAAKRTVTQPRPGVRYVRVPRFMDAAVDARVREIRIVRFRARDEVVDRVAREDR